MTIMTTIEPRWLTIARGELGQHEQPGARHNPRILEYHQATSLKASDDETPWCSAFANWALRQAGLTGSGSAAARSWLSWGVPLSRPVPGAIAVFSRPPNPGSGHVAFVVSADANQLQVLGGNQGDAVSIHSYPHARLLALRWPAGVPLPAA